MKKKILGFILAICLILPSTIMSACDDGITDCAYVQFSPAIDGEVVQYTSQMYSAYSPHIYLFDSVQTRDNGEGNWDSKYLLTISFKRNLGVDFNIDTKETLCVDIEKTQTMTISIKKSYWNDNKKVYLNGNDITSLANSALSKSPVQNTSSPDFWYDGVYYFEDFGLIKGNSSNHINIIEYK